MNRRTVDHGPTAAPAAYPSVVDGALDRVRDGLVEGISSVVGAQVAGDMVEVTLPLLRRARTCPGSVGRPDAPFAWKPVFARRSLGLAAVRACADGRFRGPAEAVGPLAWPVVRAVVLEAQSLTDLAGSHRSRDTGPWMAALVEGLMAAARVYKMV